MGGEAGNILRYIEIYAVSRFSPEKEIDTGVARGAIRIALKLAYDASLVSARSAILFGSCRGCMGTSRPVEKATQYIT